jgi:predicted nucleic acid-binding protein
LVYVDAQCVIYSVERHPTFAPPLDPFWLEVQAGRLTAATSELTILEALVLPIRNGDTTRVREFEDFFRLPGVQLLPITPDILRHAARMRATITRFRTPDAIHAATALAAGVALFVTNDLDFRNVPGLPVEVLKDVIARP